MAWQRTLAAYPGVQAERAAGSPPPAGPSPWPGVRGRRGSSCALPRESGLPGTVGHSPRCRRAGRLPGSCWRKVQRPNECLTRLINQGARVGAEGLARVRAGARAGQGAQTRHRAAGQSRSRAICTAKNGHFERPATRPQRCPQHPGEGSSSPHSRRQRQVLAVAPVSGRCPQELPPILQSWGWGELQNSGELFRKKCNCKGGCYLL